MTHVVTESCIKCKYTDCVDVCPVDCFREGPNFLSIDPDECIDCAVCIPECPVNAIYAEEDVPEDQRDFIKLNVDLSKALAVDHAHESRTPPTPTSGKTCAKSAICSSADHGFAGTASLIPADCPEERSCPSRPASSRKNRSDQFGLLSAGLLGGRTSGGQRCVERSLACYITCMNCNAVS